MSSIQGFSGLRSPLISPFEFSPEDVSLLEIDREEASYFLPPTLLASHDPRRQPRYCALAIARIPELDG